MQRRVAAQNQHLKGRPPPVSCPPPLTGEGILLQGKRGRQERELAFYLALLEPRGHATIQVPHPHRTPGQLYHTPSACHTSTPSFGIWQKALQPMTLSTDRRVRRSSLQRDTSKRHSGSELCRDPRVAREHVHDAQEVRCPSEATRLDRSCEVHAHQLKGISRAMGEFDRWMRRTGGDGGQLHHCGPAFDGADPWREC